MAFTDDFLEVVLCAQLLFEIAVLFFQLATQGNNSAVTIPDPDRAGYLAGDDRQSVDVAGIKVLFPAGADEQSADYVSPVVQWNPAPRLDSSLKLPDGWPSTFPFDLRHQQRFLVDENPAFRRSFYRLRSVLKRNLFSG